MKDLRGCRGWVVLASVSLACIVICQGAHADEVIMANGDVITGEILTLEGGKRCKKEGGSPIAIEEIDGRAEDQRNQCRCHQCRRPGHSLPDQNGRALEHVLKSTRAGRVVADPPEPTLVVSYTSTRLCVSMLFFNSELYASTGAADRVQRGQSCRSTPVSVSTTTADNAAPVMT